MFEIYREAVFDLLSPSPPKLGGSPPWLVISYLPLGAPLAPHVRVRTQTPALPEPQDWSPPLVSRQTAYFP